MKKPKESAFFIDMQRETYCLVKSVNIILYRKVYLRSDIQDLIDDGVIVTINQKPMRF